MRKIYFLSAFLLMASLASLSAQEVKEKDPVLFTVNGHPVRVSEFVYIYEKSNGDKADYSRKSLGEYLRLYTKFKLKVERAKELKLDTIQALQQELEGYRRQLADSYLIDREVTTRLVREVYERKKQDVDISHILIKVGPNPSEEAERRAYERAMLARKELLEGKPFNEVARRYSEDKSVSRNEGHIGYVTAMFPKGLYNLETAAYSLPKGKPSEPIRTGMGYHILVVHDRRPARGEIEAAHILIRKPKEGEQKDAKAIIDSLYQILLQGAASFEDLAKKHSEDKLSASRGGYIGFFGINRYEKSFEDAAFALKEDGAFSKPFETSVGWHIVKRISKRDLGPYVDERTRILKAIKKDPRYEQAQDALVNRIKKESNFREFNTTLEHFADTLSEDFLSYKWKAPKNKSQELLFSLGDDFVVTLGDFTDFLGKSTRERIRMGRSVSVKEGVQKLYNEFVKRKVLEYEEQHLAEKYPDFRHLMREYEEGILLFEVTKREVWDVAPQDTAGLMAYYETIKGRYRWKERAKVSVYIIHSTDEKLLKKVRKYIAKKPPEKVLAKFNTDPDNPLIERGEKVFEKGRNKVLNATEWKVGAMTEPEINEREGTAAFYKIEEILPEQPKTLEESRGFVIADYQDYLERKWVKQLEEKFPVQVDQKVFETLVKE